MEKEYRMCGFVFCDDCKKKYGNHGQYVLEEDTDGLPLTEDG